MSSNSEYFSNGQEGSEYKDEAEGCLKDVSDQ